MKYSKKRYDRLVDKIGVYSHYYWIHNDPLITDFEFDELILKRRNIEKEHPEYITNNYDVESSDNITIFTDKNIVVIGNFNKYTKCKIENIIKSMGGIIESDITPTTDILISGEYSSMKKIKKAEKMHIPIVFEYEFGEIRNTQ